MEGCKDLSLRTMRLSLMLIMMIATIQAGKTDIIVISMDPCEVSGCNEQCKGLAGTTMIKAVCNTITICWCYRQEPDFSAPPPPSFK